MKGETVTVSKRVVIGKDKLGEPIYDWDHIEVGNVLVRPIHEYSSSDLADPERPDGIRIRYCLAFPKTYDGPSLAHCKIALTDRGMSFEDALDVSGSPDIVNPCPTAWNMLVNVGRIDG